MKQVDFINGVEVNEPNNYAETEIELNYEPTQEGAKARLSVNTWELGVGDPANPADAQRKAFQHFLDGLNGGVGVTEGLPYRKVIRQGTVDTEILNGYLDLWRAEYSRGKIAAPAVDKGSLSWLESGVAEFSFEYLYAAGKITEADFVLVPYVMSTIPNYREAFMATITVYFITDRIIQEIQGIIELTSEAANPLEATAIARLVLRIVYIATLLLALVKLIFDIFNLIIQPIKYHAGMYVNDLLRIGAEHMGLTYESSFLKAAPLDKLFILPKKFFTKNNTGGVFAAVQGLFDKDKTGQKGFPGEGYTYAQLLADLQLQFNAKIILDGTTLRIEKWNYTLATPKYRIPAIERSLFTLNEEDFFSNIVIKFATDLNDKNTLQEYLGALYQVQIVQAATNNKPMRLTKRLKTININYALAKRKTELSFPEKIFDAFFKGAAAVVGVLVDVINVVIDVVNGIIKLLNKIIKALGVVGIDINFQIPPINKLDPPTFGDMIEDRLDMMKMENDFVDVSKMMLIGNNTDARNNKLLPNNETVLSAKYMWDNHWFFISFVPQNRPDGLNAKGNQWKKFPIDKVDFQYEDWQKVRFDNIVEDTDGSRNGKLDTWKWNVTHRFAGGQFRINETYTNNLIEIKTEPNGI